MLTFFNTNVSLENCDFASNKIIPSCQKNSEFRGIGVFLVTRMSVKLQGAIHFIQNEETALLLRSTYIFNY